MGRNKKPLRELKVSTSIRLSKEQVETLLLYGRSSQKGIDYLIKRVGDWTIRDTSNMKGIKNFKVWGDCLRISHENNRKILIQLASGGREPTLENKIELTPHEAKKLAEHLIKWANKKLESEVGGLP